MSFTQNFNSFVRFFRISLVFLSCNLLESGTLFPFYETLL